MMDEKRLELAFELLKDDNWRLFERYASAFFASEYPNLRTMANASGDDGRDAEIFSPEGRPNIALQYSVTTKWKEKVRKTAKRLEETGNKCAVLIYATNQLIGANADDLKRDILSEYAMFLDVRDRSYFLERFRQDESRQRISEELARQLVDPLLESKGIIQRKAQVLTPGESRAALVFLELQWADDVREKGLTKITFEALVRSALRDTSLDNPMDLAEIYQRVCEMLPEHDREFALREIDKALRRLDKTVVRHYQKEERYCLTNEEVERLKKRFVELQVEDEALKGEIVESILALSDEGGLLSTHLEEAQASARASIERFFMERGELFVEALGSGQLQAIGLDDIRAICKEELAKILSTSAQHPKEIEALARSVEKLLVTPTPQVSTYLRSLSDAYTLRAFLRQTPDVQEAVKKMFSVGEIWLDTSIILPLIAEGLLPGPDRNFRRLIAAAVAAGLSLKVTPGVVEEVERHMNRAQVCAATPSHAWQGPIPYLLSVYVFRGYDTRTFSDWLGTFRGAYRPEDDIAEYVGRAFKVVRQDISEDAARAPQELRTEVQSVWQGIHLERRQRRSDWDEMVALRMASHDVENYVGVIARRNREQDSALGYTSWWLTLDQRAFGVAGKLSRHILGRYQSPVMSTDFLANYLAVGPLRGRVTNSDGPLPVSLDVTITDGLSRELFDLAGEIRQKNAGQPESFIQRQVRDGLDKAKRRTGIVHARGLSISEDLD